MRDLDENTPFWRSRPIIRLKMSFTAPTANHNVYLPLHLLPKRQNALIGLWRALAAANSQSETQNRFWDQKGRVLSENSQIGLFQS